jgi:hypothetical protein
MSEPSEDYKKGYRDGLKDAADFAELIFLQTCSTAPNACDDCKKRASIVKDSLMEPVRNPVP